jgi:hypothetical protein
MIYYVLKVRITAGRGGEEKEEFWASCKSWDIQVCIAAILGVQRARSPFGRDADPGEARSA